jgi:hypothetical protein
MNEPQTDEKAAHGNETHGLTRLKGAVNRLGSWAIDRRTSLGKALDQWKGSLVADLGGMDMISTQELAIVNLAVKTKLLLDSVDTATPTANIGQWAKEKNPCMRPLRDSSSLMRWQNT